MKSPRRRPLRATGEGTQYPWKNGGILAKNVPGPWEVPGVATAEHEYIEIFEDMSFEAKGASLTSGKGPLSFWGLSLQMEDC